ncbi:hypothetical protein Tco_0945644 [Tanacetum coccineum]
MEAIEKRYGGNKESKKVQRTLLKQQYENFVGSSSETIDQTFDRLQKLITQLEIQGEVITQEDMNLKLLRSLPSEWKTHALIWRNKQEIKTISLDDLYNNLKIYESEISVSSSISQNPQNVAFVSSNSTNSNSSTNEADNTTYGVSAAHTQSNHASGDNLSDAAICAFLASQPNSPQLAQEDLEQIDPDDLEEMDLQWEMVMLIIRARRFIQRTGGKLDVNGQKVRFDRTKVECYNSSSNAATPAVESFVNSSEMLENQENNKSKSDKGYHAVPPPFTGNFIPFKPDLTFEHLYYVCDKKPHKPDLTFMDEIVKSENLDVTTVVTPSNVKTVESNHESANVKRQPTAERGNLQQKEYKEKGVIDSGCSRYMTGNKCYLTEYGDYDGGFVSFRDGKGRISRKGNGPDWLFDVDSLTISMNYVPVIAGNQTNGIAGKEDNTVYRSNPKVSEEDAKEKPTEMDESGASDKDGKDDF